LPLSEFPKQKKFAATYRVLSPDTRGIKGAVFSSTDITTHP